MSDVAAYLAALDEPARSRVGEVLDLVRTLLPDAEERISYDIPTFVVADRAVVHVAGWARHLALYPVPDTAEAPELEALLAPYRAGKGTLRFEHRDPLPVDVLTAVVRALGRI
ncbi:DUF1801 domain-containing protein [Nocardioides fonticola]|uniref:DUF1801 domain-containing protein n=1 Tax=Nocardioides fonticola TaxID=450363 RepID=A0ABP7XLH0_9ACTN